LYRLLFVVLTISLAPELKGQSSDGTPAGRLEQIQAQQIEKQRNIRTERPTESRFGRIVDSISRTPISFSVGGLGTGAGPAVNVLLQKSVYDDHIFLRMWGSETLHNFYSVGAGAEWRNFAAHDLTFRLEGSHSDAPQLDYYGAGPDSHMRNHTDFRREETLFNFRAGLRTHRTLAEACRAAELLLHVGPGTNSSLASTQSVFGPFQAPGINVENDYFIAGCSAQLDLRDFPEDPHDGTYAEAMYDRYFPQSHGEFSFHRLSFLGEQYVPFWNDKRVIALRGRTEFSFHSDDQVVPFYLQPTLASESDLRGFRRYRFYDENLISLTAEYRWEISTGWDMALFVDGGKVFHRPGQLSFSRLESSAGFGFRIKNQSERRVVAWFDVGFSREGFQVWLRVPHLF